MKNGTRLTAGQVRDGFIDFFRQRGHAFVPSSSLLPAGDATLLFTNAGMNQFKAIFLGTEKPAATRVANSQKCIRAGGKHNDLEDVGHDTYHHTFFEMLGNWSFGDYFKEDAIRWAWELLTGVWHLPKERLHATVFGGDEGEQLAPDDEAADLWRNVTDIDPTHIHRGSKKDNFWEMGETGPCGPCSEIHYDFTPDLSGGPLVNVGDARVMEFWNLVFMQFNRGADGKLQPLPAKHVDTGMGLERVTRILQGVDSNYGIDVFRSLFDATQRLSQAGPYKGSLDDLTDVAYRVIADHARALVFAIADGIIPSNEGRGYVVRRILRRAARYGRQYLKIEGPFLSKLAPTVAELMGDAFPEVRQRQKQVIETIAAEEKAFGRTLDRGIEHFAEFAVTAIGQQIATERGWSSPVITGPETAGATIDAGWEFEDKDGKEHKLKCRREPPRDFVRRECRARPNIIGGDVFDLYATFGFPVDLTKLMAEEWGLGVDDKEGYERAKAEHREVSAAGGGAFKVEALTNLPSTDASAKYLLAPISAKVLGWVREGKFVAEGALSAGEEVAVVLEKTNFYGEQGGQVGDSGELVWPGRPGEPGGAGKFLVRQAVLAGECVLHLGRVQEGSPSLRVGMDVSARVDASRRDTMRNHTATHLLNWALRKVLGDHVDQAGSVVAPDRLRFDFTHNQAVTPEQLAQAERLVNERVLEDVSVTAGTMPLSQAKGIPGVRAVFGEKYPDPVRVIVIGGAGRETGANGRRPELSTEFCGGTHLERTGHVGFFKIVSEESVAKGVRRITAVTGRAAIGYVQEIDAAARQAAGLLRVAVPELPARVEALQKELKEARKSRTPAGGGGDAFAPLAEIDSPAGKVLVARVDGADPAGLRTVCDVQRQKGAAAIFLGSLSGENVTLVAMVSEELAKAKRLSAGEWVKAIAPIVGGSGGGKPTLAQAGGRDGAKLAEALQGAAEWARQKLAGG